MRAGDDAQNCEGQQDDLYLLDFMLVSQVSMATVCVCVCSNAGI